MQGAGFSYQPNIIGKPDKTLIQGDNAPLKRYLSYGFRFNNGDLDELIQAATQEGFLWTAAVLKQGGHRHGSKFIAASWVGLDIDNKEGDTPLPMEQQLLPQFFIEHPVLKDAIAFGYDSPSHDPNVCNKFRLVLKLPHVIRDRAEYRLITQKIQALVPGLDDCCDEVRLWFGNTKGAFHVDRDASLDLDALDAAFKQLPEDQQEQAIKAAINPTLTLEERIARGWVSPGSASETDSEVDKEILSLLLPHLPVAEESGSYNSIRKTLMAVADRWGAEQGTVVLDELGYAWPREKPLFETLSDLDRQTGCNYRFPSLIKETTELVTWQAEASNDARLALLQKRAFAQTELNTVEAVVEAFGTTEGFKVTDFTPPTDEELVQTKLQQIEVRIEALFQLELDPSAQHFAKKQILMKELQDLGVRKEHMDDQIFDKVSAYLGADLKNTGGKAIRAKTGRELLHRRGKANVTPLIEKLLLKNRDHVIYGDAGTGKTLFALYAMKSLTHGNPIGDIPKVRKSKGKFLYIGSDSGVANEDQLHLYLDQMGLLEDEQFLDRFMFRSADENEGIAQWNFNTHNLIWLKQLLAEEQFDLVVIDSLKAVCGNTRYSIDERNIADVMRLMQSIVLPTSTLVYIHHSNKSGTRSTHRSAGCTDVIEVPSAAIEMVKELEEKSHDATPEYWCKVHKLRGDSHRSFEIDFDWKKGMLAKDAYTLDDLFKDLQAKKSSLHLQILKFGAESPGRRFSISGFIDSLGEEAPHRSSVGRVMKDLTDELLIKDTSDLKRGTFAMLQPGVDLAKKMREQDSDF